MSQSKRLVKNRDRASQPRRAAPVRAWESPAVWLNPFVRVYTKFKPTRKKKHSPRLAVLLLLTALGLTGWWWWKSHDAAQRVVAANNTARSSSREPRPAPLPVRLTETNLPKTEQLLGRPGQAATPPASAPVETKRPAPPVDRYPRPVRDVFEAQLALAQLDLSPGSLDGAAGSQTRAALCAFQQQQKLPVTGALDSLTKNRLVLASGPLTNYVVTTNDLLRLRPLGRTWLEKSEQGRLDFESILELVAERSEAHPALITRLNPSVNWTNLAAGTILVIPNATPSPPADKAAFARIELEHRSLQAFDRNTNLIAHFPCSIAKFAEKRPVGELHVAVVAPNPNYTFDPDNFPESAEARSIERKLVLQPGPNNPVGTVWIGLDRPGYGIHGTPSPEQVGRTESHGCFRLANWNAETFLQLVWVGMSVYVEP